MGPVGARWQWPRGCGAELATVRPPLLGRWGDGQLGHLAQLARVFFFFSFIIYFTLLYYFIFIIFNYFLLFIYFLFYSFSFKYIGFINNFKNA